MIAHAVLPVEQVLRNREIVEEFDAVKALPARVD